MHKNDKIIYTKDLSFTYAGSDERSLKEINFNVADKKVTAIIGPSGCGKSTLLRSLNRIHDVQPGNKYEGKVMLYDKNKEEYKNILKIKKEEEFINLRRMVGMIFQKPTPFPMSIEQNITYGLKISGVKNKSLLTHKVEEALKSVALWKEVKDRLKKDARGLSGGQQQRLCIARTVALKPEIILFDEPTSALDPISTLAIEEMMYQLKQKFAICIVTHNMQQASRVSDFTAFMYLGDLVEMGKTDKIFTSPKKIQTEDYISGKFS